MPASETVWTTAIGSGGSFQSSAPTAVRRTTRCAAHTTRWTRGRSGAAPTRSVIGLRCDISSPTPPPSRVGSSSHQPLDSVSAAERCVKSSPDAARWGAERVAVIHKGMVVFSQRVEVPVGPSGPSSATRTTSRGPSSTDSAPSYPLRFVLVKPGETRLTLMSLSSSSTIMASVIAFRAVLDAR